MAQTMVSPLTAAPTVPPPASAAASAATSAATPIQGNAGVQHLEVEGSFVYHGDEAVHDYYAAVARLSLSTDNSKLALALLPKVSMPVVKNPPPEKKPGFLHRFGSIFGKLFRK
jgi:hypothetical protein